MKGKIDIKKVLRVFNLIISEGTRTHGNHCLEGLTAVMGFDGYSATIMNDYVSLTVHFHSKFTFQAGNKREEKRFLEKIDSLDKKY